MKSFQRREHTRYKTKPGILAAVPVSGTLTVIVGQVIDISENGLGLRHEDKIATSIDRSQLVLMGHEQCDYPVFEIPARLVYEKNVGENHRSGFQFDKLSKHQRSQLTSFIESNAESMTV